MQAYVSTLPSIAILCAMAFGGLGCTLVRYVDGMPDDIDDPPPAVVDLLVMVPLDRGAANLTTDYEGIISLLNDALSDQNIELRKAAMAPLYGRADSVVPLVYGLYDEDAEFAGFAQTIEFYTRDAGADYLQNQATSEAENLAILGQELANRPIYHPTTADPTARAYFVEPADGFIVMHLSAVHRRCDISAADCEIDQMDPVSYFTRADGGIASWLDFPGPDGLAVDKIFHAAVVTAEAVAYDDFYAQCLAYPNFPATDIDVMEPSSVSYYGPFVDGIRANGGHAAYLDLCETMSSRGKGAMKALAKQIRTMVN